MHAVSGSISPLPGFFFAFPHGTGSLSVDHEYLALEDGPHIQTGFHVPALLVANSQYRFCFRIRDYHPLWSADFPDRVIGASAITCRLFPFLLLATTLGISVDFLFLRLLRCFSSPGSLYPRPYVFSMGYPCGVGFPIRTSTDQSLFASSPSFSQAATSFIACDRQGIHHMHLVA